MVLLNTAASRFEPGTSRLRVRSLIHWATKAHFIFPLSLQCKLLVNKQPLTDSWKFSRRDLSIVSGYTMVRPPGTKTLKWSDFHSFCHWGSDLNDHFFWSEYRVNRTRSTRWVVNFFTLLELESSEIHSSTSEEWISHSIFFLESNPPCPRLCPWYSIRPSPYSPQSPPSRKRPSRKRYGRQFIAKFSWTWQSRGSYGIYMYVAVTRIRPGPYARNHTFTE